MSDFNWCHGPECHEKKTQDRVRGTKGNKVLRTRKVVFRLIHMATQTTLGIGFVVIHASEISGKSMAMK